MSFQSSYFDLLKLSLTTTLAFPSSVLISSSTATQIPFDANVNPHPFLAYPVKLRHTNNVLVRPPRPHPRRTRPEHHHHLQEHLLHQLQRRRSENRRRSRRRRPPPLSLRPRRPPQPARRPLNRLPRLQNQVPQPDELLLRLRDSYPQERGHGRRAVQCDGHGLQGGIRDAGRDADVCV